METPKRSILRRSDSASTDGGKKVTWSPDLPSEDVGLALQKELSRRGVAGTLQWLQKLAESSPSATSGRPDPPKRSGASIFSGASVKEEEPEYDEDEYWADWQAFKKLGLSSTSDTESSHEASPETRRSVKAAPVTVAPLALTDMPGDPAKKAGGQLVIKRTIIPPGSDKPIVQEKVDIFDRANWGGGDKKPKQSNGEQTEMEPEPKEPLKRKKTEEPEMNKEPKEKKKKKKTEEPETDKELKETKKQEEPEMNKEPKEKKKKQEEPEMNEEPKEKKKKKKQEEPEMNEEPKEKKKKQEEPEMNEEPKEKKKKKKQEEPEMNEEPKEKKKKKKQEEPEMDKEPKEKNKKQEEPEMNKELKEKKKKKKQEEPEIEEPKPKEKKKRSEPETEEPTGLEEKNPKDPMQKTKQRKEHETEEPMGMEEDIETWSDAWTEDMQCEWEKFCANGSDELGLKNVTQEELLKAVALLRATRVCESNSNTTGTLPRP